MDARIQEDGQTTILMDYMVVLEPDDIRVTEFGVGTDVPYINRLHTRTRPETARFPITRRMWQKCFC